MKRIIILLGLFFVISGLPTNIYAQCSPGQYTEQCIPKLADGFNFVKSYEIDGEGGSKKKVEYSYVFAKGTQYFINICNGGEGTDGIVLNLYNSNREKVGTSYTNGKFNKGIVYPCKSTGIYYITFTFKESQNHCGGAVLGFKR